MKFFEWFGKKSGYIGLVLFAVFMFGSVPIMAIVGCKKKPAYMSNRIVHEMVYFKDPKSKQCFAVAGKRMAWVPCSAVKEHLEEIDD